MDEDVLQIYKNKTKTQIKKEEKDKVETGTKNEKKGKPEKKKK